MLVSERRVVLGWIAVALCAAAVYSYAFLPLYRSEAILSVQEVWLGASQPTISNNRVIEIVNRQITEINSLEFAAALVPKLAEADAADLRYGPVDTFGRRASSEWNRWFGASRELTQSEAVIAFRSRLKATWRESSWVELRYVSADPEGSVRVLNQVIQAVLASVENQNNAKRAQSSNTFDRRLAEGREKLGDELGTLKENGEAEGMDVEARRQVLQQQSRGFTEALVEAQTTRAARAASRRIASQKGGAALAARSDPQVMVASGRLAELEEREKMLLANLGEKHPDVAAVREQVAGARARLASLVETFRESAETQYRLAVEEEKRLKDQVQRTQAELAALDSVSVDYSLAKRKADWTRLSLDSLLQKQQLTSDTVLEANLVQPPRRPMEPFDPRKGQTFAFAFGVALLASVTFVLLRDQLNETVRQPEDFLKIPSVRLLGSIPKLRSLKGSGIPAALVNPKDGYSDSVRVIRTNVMLAPGASRRMKVIVITSPSPQEGKSTAAISLALALREVSSRVLLIDADLRRPSLHLAFGVPLMPGLAELAAVADNPKVTRRGASAHGIDIIPAGNPQVLSSALVGSETMGAILERARADYDWVIIDAPPALALPDASVLAAQADGVIIVCASEQTRFRDMQAVLSQVVAIGATVIGAVINRVDMNRHSYYYGRAYSSYYQAANVARKA